MRDEWSSWVDPVEYYLFGWLGKEHLPDALRSGVADTLGSDFAPRFIYPVGEYGEGRVSFFAVTDDDLAILIDFDPPSATKISFLGSLAGGTYMETIDTRHDPHDQITGTFAHPRLGEGGPIEVRFRSGPHLAPGDHAHHYVHRGQEQARAMFERARETFRRWATEPEHRPPGPT